MKCVVTGVERRDTPEERVRQAIASELMTRYGYRREDMRLELPVQMGSSADKRADIAIFRSETEAGQRDQHSAYILIECKRADVSNTDFAAAKDQLRSYMAACSNAHFGMVIAGNRRVCYREIKHPDGHYKTMEVNDIPSAMAPRAHFTVVRPSQASPLQGAHSPHAYPLESSPRSGGRTNLPLIALGGVMAIVMLGGACFAAMVWMSRSGSADHGGGIPVTAPVATAGPPAGLPAVGPRVRTAPPSQAEWASIREVRLAPAGCYRKMMRDWLKLNCASHASPRSIGSIRDMGAEGTDHYKWERPGSVIDLVVRMVPGRRGEAVFEVSEASITVGYDWTRNEQSPALVWRQAP
jgi:hypothetical protein